MIIINTILKIMECICAQETTNHYEKIDLLSNKKIENSMNYINLEVSNDYDIIDVKDL